jgi:hypothetical protein
VRHLPALCCFLLLSACAEDYTVFHSQTGQPILLTRRGVTLEHCVQAVREEGTRLGVTFRYIHVKGSLFGQSLLWPFEKGYVCEAAIGPERFPTGIYPRSLYAAHHNSF